MRTHSLILSAAVHTPVVAINSYPKTAGFMKTIGQEQWLIDFDKLTTESLTDLVKCAWSEHQQTRETMASLVEQQAKARRSVELIGNLLEAPVSFPVQATA